MSVWEIIAAVFGIVYVILAAKENIWCWPTGLINVSITFFISFNHHLYGYALVQVIFFVMTINAWYLWAKKSSNDHKYPVTRTASKNYLYIVPIMIGSSVALWYIFGHPDEIFKNVDPSPFPLWESIATSIFIVGMRMQARKKVDNWLMWIVGDIIYAFLLFYTHDYAFAILSVIYIVVAIIGWVEWRKSMLKSQAI